MFSTTFRYGLISLLELAASDERLQAGAIAARNNLSPHYLAVVLADLRKLGLVQSRKGKNGGYELVCDPRQVSLLDLYLSLAGGSEEDLREGSGGEGQRPPGQTVAAGAAQAWLFAFNRRWSAELASTSLADLLR